jgi:hypothetical protein
MQMDRWQHCLLAGQWLRIQGVMLRVEFVRYWFAIFFEGVMVSTISVVKEANDKSGRERTYTKLTLPK